MIEALLVIDPDDALRKTVISAEPSDSLTFVRNESEGRVRADDVTDPFKLTVDRVLAAWRLKRERIEESIDVFRETLDQIPALRQACTAFENDLVARSVCDSAQRLAHVIVLLDDCRSQTSPAENAPQRA